MYCSLVPVFLQYFSCLLLIFIIELVAGVLAYVYYQAVSEILVSISAIKQSSKELTPNCFYDGSSCWAVPDWHRWDIWVMTLPSVHSLFIFVYFSPFVLFSLSLTAEWRAQAALEQDDDRELCPTWKREHHSVCGQTTARCEKLQITAFYLVRIETKDKSMWLGKIHFIFYYIFAIFVKW